MFPYLMEQTGRSEVALRKDLGAVLDSFQKQRLQVACDNDPALFERVRPYAGLLRQDTFGFPVVITADSVYVTEGTDRRTTGTHYTPRSLTEPIVQHTLDPLVYIGPAEGKPEVEWRLHPAAHLLNLKVCDMAMGSGAFLVQACRYLAEKLVQAWEEYENTENTENHRKHRDFIEKYKNTETHREPQINTENFISRPDSREDKADSQTNQKTNKESSVSLSGSQSSSVFQNSFLQITPEGLPSKGEPGETLVPVDLEERLALARRLVAERCLYGVDKNPMAVEMAKLSLWLITLDKGQPFTFLDHALRCGDSLLGVNLRQLRNWNMKAESNSLEIQYSWINNLMDRALHVALRLRHQIAAITTKDVRDTERKEMILREADKATDVIKLGADLLLATELAEPNRRGIIRDTLHEPYRVMVSAFEERASSLLNRKQSGVDQVANEQAFSELREQVDQLLLDPRYPNQPSEARDPFHWPLEFPEVFMPTGAEEPGFAALIGNPPFQGGKMITGALGTDYRDYLIEFLAKSKRGHADLCAYFFLRAESIVKLGGQAGLIATNTIAQGDTREVGLDQLVNAGWVIPRAVPSRKWPGSASLEVAHIWLRHGIWQSLFVLEEIPVVGITSFLTIPGTTEGKPYPLVANAAKSFNGSYVLGMGFVLDPEEAQALIAKDPRNKKVLFPYLNGEDLNSSSDQSPSRWVIQFHDWPLKREKIGKWSKATDKDKIAWLRKGIVPEDYPDSVAYDYPDCIKIVEERVKPERLKVNDKVGKEIWWRFLRIRPELHSAIAGMKRVLAIVCHTKYTAFSWQPTGIVFSHAMAIIAFDHDENFAIIQNTLHDVWVRFYSSSLGNTLRYSPSDCFETYPFPEDLSQLGSIGEEYNQQREAIMVLRGEGLTQTYNRFHDPKEMSADIVRLRELHREMDLAIAAAYGWQDLDLAHAFYETKQGLRYTISEKAKREVLGRLLKLNHERHAQELADGLHDKKKGKAGKKGGNTDEHRNPPRNTEKDKNIKNSVSLSSLPQPLKQQSRLFDVEPAGSLWANLDDTEEE
ncbi:MAG: hypothetical protein HXX20_22850 [Chloroflexi bacterium]|nr:hypothetical protein [Chloroflexota bacterium]